MSGRKRRGKGRRRNAVGAATVAGCMGLSGGVALAQGPIPVPDAVVSALGEALADERNALGTYQAIMERFGQVRPFVNIARAEQRHIDALMPLYYRYELTVPEDETKLDPQVHTSEMLALCQLGVTAEIENVRLYDETLLPAVAAYPDISAVMHRLRDASKNNHLPAFQRCVERGSTPGRGIGQGRGHSGHPRGTQ